MDFVLDAVNTNEMVQHVADRHLLSPMVCDIRDPVANGLLSSNAHNSTAIEKFILYSIDLSFEIVGICFFFGYL